MKDTDKHPQEGIELLAIVPLLGLLLLIPLLIFIPMMSFLSFIPLVFMPFMILLAPFSSSSHLIASTSAVMMQGVNMIGISVALFSAGLLAIIALPVAWNAIKSQSKNTENIENTLENKPKKNVEISMAKPSKSLTPKLDSLRAKHDPSQSVVGTRFVAKKAISARKS